MLYLWQIQFILKIVYGVTERDYTSVEYHEDFLIFYWNLNSTETDAIIFKLGQFESFITDRYSFINIEMGLSGGLEIYIEVAPLGIDVRREWGIKIN